MGSNDTSVLGSFGSYLTGRALWNCQLSTSTGIQDKQITLHLHLAWA